MAEANSIESCSACRFFLAPNGAIGVCRRYPTHQNRHGNDWCGEFAYKKIEQITQEFLQIIVHDINERNKPKRGRPAKVKE